MIKVNTKLINDLLDKAATSERKRVNYDLRTSSDDQSQRMLNALMPGTKVDIHRHPQSTESVFILCGKLTEIFYDNEGIEKDRIELDPSVGIFGCVVPTGVWHTIEVHEPSVIFEAKDGKYGEDGSEMLKKWT